MPRQRLRPPVTLVAALGAQLEMAEVAVRQFGELEGAIMQRLWSRDQPTTVRVILEDLRADRQIAYTTVQTVMDNLYRKGVLNRALVGRAYEYWPVRSREDHSAQLMQEVLAASSDQTTTLLRFVEQLRPDELARLRGVLDQAGRGRDRDRGRGRR